MSISCASGAGVATGGDGSRGGRVLGRRILRTHSETERTAQWKQRARVGHRVGRIKLTVPPGGDRGLYPALLDPRERAERTPCWRSAGSLCPEGPTRQSQSKDA